MSCDKISQALPPLFFGAGQRSYMELLRGRRESLGTRLGCTVLLCLVCLFDLACLLLSFFLLISYLKTCTCTNVLCVVYFWCILHTCTVHRVSYSILCFGREPFLNCKIDQFARGVWRHSPQKMFWTALRPNLVVFGS